MKYVLVAFIVGIVFSGCDTTPKPKDPIVNVIDSCSNNYIKILDLKGRIKDDGFMQAQIRGKNITNSYFRVKYKIVWLDANGFIIDSILSNWTTTPADANQPFYIHAISPNTKAKSFRFYLKKEGETICQQQSDSL
jgi:uncharacterized protein YcfL